MVILKKLNHKIKKIKLLNILNKPLSHLHMMPMPHIHSDLLMSENVTDFTLKFHNVWKQTPAKRQLSTFREISNVQFYCELKKLLWNVKTKTVAELCFLWLLKIFLSFFSSCSLLIIALRQQRGSSSNSIITAASEWRERNKREVTKKRAYSHGRHEAIIFITNYHSLSRSHAKLKVLVRSITYICKKNNALDRWSSGCVFRACLCI